MLTTRFTNSLGCSVPIQQAGMGGGITTPALAAAVANAGGLGMVAVYGDGYTPDGSALDVSGDRSSLPALWYDLAHLAV